MVENGAKTQSNKNIEWQISRIELICPFQIEFTSFIIVNQTATINNLHCLNLPTTKTKGKAR